MPGPNQPPADLPGEPLSSRPHQPTPFQALTQDLVWPMLLRAPALSLRPARLGLGTLATLLVGMLWQIPGLFSAFPDHATPLSRMADAAHSDALAWLAASADALTLRGWLVLLASALLLSILGGAIARATALEFARRQRLSWPGMLRFSLIHARGFAGLVLLPAAALFLTWLLIRLFGWALLSLPWIQLVGAVLFFIPMLLGLGACLLAAGLALGLPMLAPSLACEGIDAIDSLQRTLAYVVGRPVVLACKLILLGVLGLAMLWLAHLIADAALATILPAALSTRAASEGITPQASPSWSRAASFQLVHTWALLPHALLGGLAVSYFFSAGTLLYLSMRHACDHQDPEDLWSPADGTTP